MALIRSNSSYFFQGKILNRSENPLGEGKHGHIHDLEEEKGTSSGFVVKKVRKSPANEMEALFNRVVFGVGKVQESQEQGKAGIILKKLSSNLKNISLTSPQEQLKLCIDILKAIRRVHHFGIVHGDLHAGNICLDTNGKIVICDYGMARWQGNPAYFIKNQKHKHYAPELNVKCKERKAEFKQDVFSLGILFDSFRFRSSDFNSLVTCMTQPDPCDRYSLDEALTKCVEVYNGLVDEKEKIKLYDAAEELEILEQTLTLLIKNEFPGYQSAASSFINAIKEEKTKLCDSAPCDLLVSTIKMLNQVQTVSEFKNNLDINSKERIVNQEILNGLGNIFLGAMFMITATFIAGLSSMFSSMMPVFQHASMLSASGNQALANTEGLEMMKKGFKQLSARSSIKVKNAGLKFFDEVNEASVKLSDSIKVAPKRDGYV